MINRESVRRPAKAALFVLAAFLSLPALAAPAHVTLEAWPAAPFPYLGKFGTITIDVYPSGVHARALMLRGFSRNGAPGITVLNPVARMYTDVPISELAAILSKLGAGSGSVEGAAAPQTIVASTGKVGSIAAVRHRLMFGPAAWIDYWTTTSIPENPQLRKIAQAFVAAVSPGTARGMAGIRGMPLYVELNFRRFKNVPLLKLKAVSADVSGQEDELSVGSLYFKAPLIDAIWR